MPEPGSANKGAVVRPGAGTVTKGAASGSGSTGLGFAQIMAPLDAGSTLDSLAARLPSPLRRALLGEPAGAPGSVLCAFASALLEQAPRRLSSRFRAADVQASLLRVLGCALAALNDAAELIEGDPDARRLRAFLLAPPVLQQFLLFLDPTRENTPDLDILQEELEAQGLAAPGSRSSVGPLAALAGGYAQAVAQEAALQEVVPVTAAFAMAARFGWRAPTGPGSEEQEFRRQIEAEFGYLTFRGIAPAGKAISLPLLDVYVDLVALADIPDEADTYSEEERRLLAEARLRSDGNRAREQELELELDSLRRRRWRSPSARGREAASLRRGGRGDRELSGGVILGDPGAGKTTLLQFLALCAATGRLPAAGTGGFAANLLRRWDPGQPPLPIFVPMAAYDDHLRRTGADLSLEEFLPVYYEKWRGQPGLGDLFSRTLEQGRALLLLDGLDEVLNAATRTWVAEQVSHLVRRHSAAGNGWVVTSRIFGYREAPLAGDFAHFTILDLGPREIESFAKKWCETYEVWAAGGRHEVALRLAAEETQALLADVRSNPSVQALAASPLLLTMLALLRRQVGKLPDRRVELYDRYIRTLIDNRETTRSPGARRDPVERFDPHTVASSLMELALWLQRNHPSGCALQAEIERALVDIALNHEGCDPTHASAADRLCAQQQAERFLREMRHIAGLLAERGRGSFGFLHLTFQEFFVGRALARLSTEERWSILQPVLHDPRWREPLLLCAGWLGIIEGRSEQAASLTQQVLDAGSPDEPLLHRDLLLAAAMAADDLALTRPLLEDLGARLQALLDSPVPTLRRRAAEGLAHLARLGLPSALSLLHERLHRTDLDPELVRGLPVLLSTDRGKGLRREIVRRLSTNNPNSRAWGLEERDKALLAAAAQLVAFDDDALHTVLHFFLKQPFWYLHGPERQGIRDALNAVIRSRPGLKQELMAMLQHSLSATTGSVAESRGDHTAGDGKDDDDDDVLPVPMPDLEQLQDGVLELLGPLAAEDLEVRQILKACLQSQGARGYHQAYVALAPLFLLDGDLRSWAKAQLEQDYADSGLLAVLGPLAAVDAAVRAQLMVAADEKHKSGRAAAVEALGSLLPSDDEVRALLLKKLIDEEPPVTGAALRAVAAFVPRDSRVRAALVELARDADAPFAEEAVELLAPLLSEKDDVYGVLLDTFQERSARALAATISCIGELGRHDPDLRALILAFLLHPSAYVQDASARALGAAVHDPQVRTTLLAYLQDGGSAGWSGCLHALAPLIAHDAEVRRALFPLLASAHEWIRRQAWSALQPHAATDASLQQALEQHADLAPARWGSDLFLAQTETDLEKEKALQWMLQALSRPEAARRRKALSSYRFYSIHQDRRFHAALRSLLVDPEADIRRQALDMLLPHDKADTALAPELRQAILNELKAPVEELVWPGTPTLAVRCAALAVPFAHQDAALLAALRGFVAQSRGVELSSVFIELVSSPFARDLAEPVVAQLQDPDAEVRAQACRSLSPLVADAGVCAALLPLLEDLEPAVRIAAMEAVKPQIAVSSGVKQAVLINLEHPDWAVLQAALRTLGAEAPDCSERICKQWNQRMGTAASFEERKQTVAELAELLPAAPALLPQLLPWLEILEERGPRGDDQSWEAHGALASGLKGLLARHPECNDVLAQALSSPSLDARILAAGALVEQPGGAPKHLWPALRRLLEDGRDERAWPQRLIIAARLLELREPDHREAALEAALGAFEFGRQPWQDLRWTAPHARTLAAAALGRLPQVPASARTQLIKALTADPDPSVRDAAYDTLLRLSATRPKEAPAHAPALAQSHEGALLHLSDLHFSDKAQAEIWLSQVVTDLTEELRCLRLDGIILSGDLSNTATPSEFEAAQHFIEKLGERMQVPRERLVLVPGNHDVSWQHSMSAYRPKRRTQDLRLQEGQYIPQGDLVEIRDNKKYGHRFKPFAKFHHECTGVHYPLEPDAQWTLTRFPELSLVVLGLNSAWELDHHFRGRASIHPSALSRALDAVQADLALRHCAKLAVWHHPVQSAGEDRIKDVGFLERLATAGFRLALHGHIHKAEHTQFRYDRSPGGRRIDFVCAGTFGAPSREWVPGYPLQYNLLRLERAQLTVETRRKEEPNGAWKPDARWLAGPGRDPLPRYHIPI